MSKKWIIFFSLIIGLFLAAPRVSTAQEEKLFINSAPPDALLVLDKSWTMTRNLSGGGNIYGNETCTGDLYASPTGSYTTNCSRFEIGKRAVKAMLDDNGDGVITKDDETLNVRFGYMTFYGRDTARDWKNGTVKVVKEIPTPYEELWSSFNAEVAYEWTPLADALAEARLYMVQHREKDNQAKACRKKFVILISDGEDSVFVCEDGYESGNKRRRATVSMAKKLWGEKIQLFVIGLYAENLPLLSNTLNWAAYYGNTDNPDPNSPDPLVNIFNPPDDPCVYSSGLPDPGSIPLSGYAFLATDAAKLNYALKKIKDYILDAKYSFSTPSVAASRTEGENCLYQASFQPVSDPFWPGSLKKYSINSDGSLGGEAWVPDAGEKLKAQNAADRKIYTRTDGTVKLFNTDLDKTFLGASTDDERKAIVGYIRGESAYNPEGWKLGDTFHSEVRVIGSPSAYYNDPRSPSAFQTFRENNKDRERIVVTGANDGQLHVFSASDGQEKYSFIPSNLLPKLKSIVHSTHPADDEQKHQYFVDGPLTAADVWLGSGDGTNKSAQDWKTLLIIAEGRGVRDKYENPAFLWSKYITCDKDFHDRYTSDYPFYCGYHALDMTVTGAASPTYRWRIRTWGVPSATYLREPWSQMAVGRVKNNGEEKWVGFIGGGYPDGKGFFVISLSSGDILWSYNQSHNAGMKYGIPASPTVVDVDNDGFVDTAYVGDLGGNMWRFKFCTEEDGPGCNTSGWSGEYFFKASSGVIRPIYTTAAVARASGSLWVYWGTGDKVDPTSPNAQERFYALADNDRTTTYTISDLTNLGADQSYSGNKAGWYLTLSGSGEKMLANPTVFGGVVLFTTYTPSSGGDLCASGGTGKLYAMAIMPLAINGITYNPGAGLMSEPSDPNSKDGGAKSIDLGMGIPGAPVISQPPAGSTGPTGIFVPISGAEGTSTEVITSPQLGDTPLTRRFRETSPRSQMIHWRDMRLMP